MKIAAYCRVSTDKADQLNSLDTQKRFFVEYAQKNRHTLTRLYADEGLSGTKVKRRREFQQMMADAEQGLFELVVVKDISRLARNTVDLLQSVRRLKALGIETVFLTANMTSMGESEFILTVFGALAQEESANMSKRVKFGKRVNAEKGKVPNLVYGYDKIPGDLFHLSINAAESAVVRQIYQWYVEDGYGGGKIAALLNGQGVRTKRGCCWNQSAVCRILANPLYTGKVINGKQEIADFLTSARADRDEETWLVVSAPELRILPDALFDRARALMADRSRAFHQEHRRESNRYLFSTLIRCKDCGWSFRRVSRTYRNTYVRWVCSRHNGQGADSCPNAAAVDEQALAEALDRYFLTLLQGHRRLESLLRGALRQLFRDRQTADAHRKSLQAQMKKLETQRGKYTALYADDLITREELEQALGRGRAELSRLESALSKLPSAPPDLAAAQRIAKGLAQRLPALVSVERFNNAQLRQLVEKIEVDKDGAVDVYLCP
ncbi:MAG: recombinase family protein [Oscillibacter sp.]|nr:recombinase family protein [Oscillibacter sp.]MDD3346176.1 recombinase family protein [Oscillibacter sp.]